MAGLPRPGVEVVQTFVTSSPTITAPTLIPCIIGPCNDVLEAYSTGLFNANALISSPATLVGTGSAASFNVGGDNLVLVVNSGAAQTITMTGAGSEALTPTAVINAINANATGVIASLANTADVTSIVIRTTASGNAASIIVDDASTATLLTALGLNVGDVSTGDGSYGNNQVFLHHSAFPVNKGKVGERTVDGTTMRSYINVGGLPYELATDESLLRPGTDVVSTDPVARNLFAQDDGDGDATTNTVGVRTTEASLTIGTGNRAWTVTALPAGNASGTNGNTNVDIIFATPNDGTGLVITYAPDNQAFDAGVAITISIGATHLTITNYALLVAALNTDATFATHFVASLATNSTGLDDIAPTHDITVASLAGGTNPPDLDAAGTQCIVLSTQGDATPATPGVGTTLITRSYGSGSSIGELFTHINATGATLAQFVVDINNNPGGGAGLGTAVHGITATVNANRLQLAVGDLGHSDSSIEIVGGTAVNALYGTPTAAVQASRTFLAAADAFVISARAGGLLDGTAGNAGTFRLIVDAGAGAGPVFTFAGTNDAPTNVQVQFSMAHADSPATYAALVALLNAENEFAQHWVATVGAGGGGGAPADADDVGPTALGLTLGGAGGVDGVNAIVQVDASTGRPIVGIHHGLPHPAIIGDSVYGDGNLIGRITGVVDAVQGNKTYTDAALTLDTEVSLTQSYNNWYLKAKNIVVGGGRPTPDLVLDADGDVTVKQHGHVDNGGNPATNAADSMYLQYTALRLDVSNASSNPALLRFSDVSDLEASIGPLNQNNPLGLAMYLSILNAPNIETSGLGVDEISATAPDGTPDGYARATDFLEAQEVYALAPLTQEPMVHQIFSTHVSAQSGITEKHERIAIVNAAMPLRDSDVVVGSGLNAESTGVASQLSVPVGEANLLQLFTNLTSPSLADPANPTASEGIFLEIASDNKRYSVFSVSAANLVTLRTAFAAGENDDNHFTTDAIPTTLINEDWSIARRGQEITTNTEIATAMAGITAGYGNRRLVWVQPDTITTVIDGINQNIEGYYACAAIAGMVGQQNPAQPFTNFPMTGFVEVIGSDSKFSISQLDLAAGGGVYWLIQDVDGAPIISRHQLTTDLASVETRELSIVKAVDYVAKFMRGSLKRFIGRYVINDQLLQILSTVAQGVVAVLIEAAVIRGGDVNRIVQDTANPDRVLIDVTLEVLYPCNYIRVTLII